MVQTHARRQFVLRVGPCVGGGVLARELCRLALLREAREQIVLFAIAPLGLGLHPAQHFPKLLEVGLVASFVRVQRQGQLLVAPLHRLRLRVRVEAEVGEGAAALERQNRRLGAVVPPLHVLHLLVQGRRGTPSARFVALGHLRKVRLQLQHESIGVQRPEPGLQVLGAEQHRAPSGAGRGRQARVAEGGGSGSAFAAAMEARHQGQSSQA
mmetsp:Transcript_20/g.56  ORF Transcript_20/g.56 Transcript_20/m.56 type:complete len:211 (+) Transcript_20:1159-1791(+)